MKLKSERICFKCKSPIEASEDCNQTLIGFPERPTLRHFHAHCKDAELRLNNGIIYESKDWRDHELSSTNRAPYA